VDIFEGAGLSKEEQTVPMKKPAQHLIAEVPRSSSKAEMTIGIDLGCCFQNYLAYYLRIIWRSVGPPLQGGSDSPLGQYDWNPQAESGTYRPLVTSREVTLALPAARLKPNGYAKYL
jgi:hypothetical protein